MVFLPPCSMSCRWERTQTSLCGGLLFFVPALSVFLFFPLEGWINVLSLPGSTHFEIIIPQMCETLVLGNI